MMMETMRLSIDEQNRLSAESGCINSRWLRSFLRWCDDLPDARNTIASLQRNHPEKFEHPKPTKPQPRPQAELLTWQQVNRLAREAAPVDRPMLASYLKWHTSTEAALRTIEILRKTHSTIWRWRVSPWEA